MIRFENISKEYISGEKVLSHVDLTINKNEFFVIVGPSGSGKTTLVKMINRLIEPTDGYLYFRDKKIKDYNIKTLRLQIGYVLQQIALFPNLNVQENIELIPELKKWTKSQREESAIELLKKVDLDPAHYLKRKPEELSGGEQQRVGILRAIAANPEIILMDEPFSALDPISRQQLQKLIKKIHQEIKSTIIFVTHDLNEAMLLGDRICIMQNGEVIQVDTPHNIQQHPANDFVANFFKTKSLTQKNVPIPPKNIQDIFGNESSPQITASEIEVEVSVRASLTSLLQLLYEHERVVVIEKEQRLYELSRVDVLQTLEKTLKEKY